MVRQEGPATDGADLADLAGLRRRLVERVRERGGALSEPVAAALRSVPRHLFVPGTPPEAAYRDLPIVTKRDADGRPISSSSQPTIMAIMLDQLGVEPGHRVLEIGAGTGYNAGLIAHLAGPGGEVVSVDIDRDVADAARSHLTAAGHPGVRVVCGDGARGFAARAPYDRVIATVGVWDLEPAWLDQIASGGRVVVPLDLRGVQCSVALERAEGHWTSRSIQPCGFMRMRGPAAGPERTYVLDRDAQLILESPAGGDLDAAATRALLAGPAAGRETGVTAGTAEVCAGFNLWLAVHQPHWFSLAESGASGLLERAPLAMEGYTLTYGVLADDGLAILRRGEGADSCFALVVDGYGPGGAEPAERLAAHVREWDAAGRPTTGDLRLDVHPRDTPDAALDGRTVIDKTHTRLALSWPNRL
ncbi:methyltransferase, FxLD system [Sphaerisporangium sp. NPDC005289]|uniref:methyltransferase, FxLD system n=1 Tax=Sphaerisporangium sp. NPDC005289 TaxID=3155247 RepID=UPI0033A20871